MTRHEPKSPTLFTEKSSESLSSANSDMSAEIPVKKLTVPNINALFAKINKEQVIKKESSVTDSMASFLKWTSEHKKKVIK
jgi:hypothetical protein